MGSPPQRFGWFNERGLPFVFLSVKVSEYSEGILRSVWRFPRIREGLRGVRGDFRGFGKDFAERAEVSEDSEGILRNAQLFPRVRKAFCGTRSCFRGFGKYFAECAAISEDSEGILQSAQPFPRARKAFRGVRSCFRGLGKHFSPFKSYFRIVDEQKTRIFRDPIYGLLIV